MGGPARREKVCVISCAFPQAFAQRSEMHAPCLQGLAGHEQSVADSRRSVLVRSGSTHRRQRSKGQQHSPACRRVHACPALPAEWNRSLTAHLAAWPSGRRPAPCAVHRRPHKARASGLTRGRYPSERAAGHRPRRRVRGMTRSPAAPRHTQAGRAARRPLTPSCTYLRVLEGFTMQGRSGALPIRVGAGMAVGGPERRRGECWHARTSHLASRGGWRARACMPMAAPANAATARSARIATACCGHAGCGRAGMQARAALR